MKVVLISKDLLFITRVKEVAGARGCEVVVIKNEEAFKGLFGDPLPEGPGTLLIDLERAVVPLNSIKLLGPTLMRTGWRCLSFYSHVNVDLAAEAREGGLGEVVPRSRFVQLIPTLF